MIPDEAIAESLSEMLQATTMLKNSAIIPDWGARSDAVKLILAYKVGLPIARKEIEVAEQSSGKDEQAIERMARIPSLLASVKNAVAQAEARKVAIEAEVITCRPLTRIPRSGS